MTFEQFIVVETSFRRKQVENLGQEAILPLNTDTESKCFEETLFSKRIIQKCSVSNQNLTSAKLWFLSATARDQTLIIQAFTRSVKPKC